MVSNSYVIPNVIRPDWNYITTQEEELLRQRLDQQQAAVKNGSTGLEHAIVDI
ncbi:hypothetical protein BDQ17DRAFT_1546973, partial [Cyathus striatus]